MFVIETAGRQSVCGTSPWRRIGSDVPGPECVVIAFDQKWQASTANRSMRCRERFTRWMEDVMAEAPPNFPANQSFSSPSPGTPSAASPNGDEATSVNAPGIPEDATIEFIGNFHKTLPHNKYGEVVGAAYREFRQAVIAPTAAGVSAVPQGKAGAAGLVAPLTGLANERLLPLPGTMTMPPAPKVQGASTAAEMVELYWMAILRDLSFSEFTSSNQQVTHAIGDIKIAFQKAVTASENGDGHLMLGRDLPKAGGNPDIRLQTLFRCGLPGEDNGPIVSQFFLKNFRYGAQYVDQRVQPYKSVDGDLKREYLITHDDWLAAQNSGRDRRGDGYSKSRPELEPFIRPFLTMRDLATFVNQDALHQAYFNAALILLNDDYAVDTGNPYPGSKERTTRQVGFGAFGGPHILSLVSEVAARALKVVWFQKWQVHRRLRPEAYGGLVQMQENGLDGTKRQYGLSDVVRSSYAFDEVQRRTGTAFLPMPFPSGSPAHPAYGAGHATVAGACVTVLKAWFDATATIKDPVDLVSVRDYPVSRDVYHPGGGNPVLPGYTGTALTVEGELNKIACNVAMGRSMGGVHFRSDNTRSLRLGEDVACIFLARELHDFVDKHPDGSNPSFTLRSFDGDTIVIGPGTVTKNGNPTYPAWLQPRP